MDKVGMLKFHKYRTIGTDYIIVDNRDGCFDKFADDTLFKRKINHRIFGVGSNGIVELKSHDTYPFEMIYHVGTGERGTACGTGSLCLVAFARDIGMVENGKEFHFKSHEGERTVSITGNLVSISMSNDCKILNIYDENNYFVDPKHYIHVRFVESSLEDTDIVKEGKLVVEMEEYKSIFPVPTFILAEVSKEGGISVRAFDPCTTASGTEIFACGTGEVGTAIAYMKKFNLTGKHTVPMKWRYGVTTVSITRDGHGNFSDIVLTGKAMYLFEGTVDIQKFKNTYGNM